MLKIRAMNENDEPCMELNEIIYHISGDFSVSAPHISTKHFTHSEYKSGIKWIQDYIDIDIKPLTEKTEAVREKFYLNTKTAEIVSTSIKALCETILGKKGLRYKLKQNRLKSDLTSEQSFAILSKTSHIRARRLTVRINCSKSLRKME